jgi:hypothetical protein
MNATHATLISLALLLVAPAPAQETEGAPSPRRPRWKPDLEKVHDPSTVMVQGDAYRFFSTGGGVSLMREQPDGRWLPEARLFERDKLPAWHKEHVPGNRGHLWAPDVIRLGNRYIGPGHASILKRDGKAYLVYHFYDGENRGRSRVRMLPLSWDEAGWPEVGSIKDGGA